MRTSDRCTTPARSASADHFAMKTAPRQIVAFGGGGFSMESGQPAARRLRARPDRGGAAAGLLPALGQRRRRPLHRPLLPRLLRPPLRGQPHLPLPPRAGARGPAPPPPLPGPDLRRRRQRRQPARRLAGARDRPDPARSLGGGGDPLRALGRLALLVRRGGDRLPRGAEAAARGSGCCRSATASTTSRSRSGASPTTASCAKGCAPATRPRTARPCTSPARN